MSLMRCDNCDAWVDTDDDPAATFNWYTDPWDGEVCQCLCERCREEMEEEDERT